MYIYSIAIRECMSDSSSDREAAYLRSSIALIWSFFLEYTPDKS